MDELSTLGALACFMWSQNKASSSCVDWRPAGSPWRHVADKPSSADNAVDDDLVSDDELALVRLSCSFCGDSSDVHPELAAALAGSRTSFSCAFLRAGGCVSNLMRRKR